MHYRTGSSPRVRGTPHLIEFFIYNPRFIPACAGNAALFREFMVRLPVHPRVCGERTAHTYRVIFAAGSSPRVRGTRKMLASRLPERRFIPACAGNASCCGATYVLLSVHPRVCGERSKNSKAKGRTTGSSPRVRGTPMAP